jgi:hypothetical protein
MLRRCTVCDHPEKHAIDEALVSSAPYQSVAKWFELSESAPSLWHPPGASSCMSALFFVFAFFVT